MLRTYIVVIYLQVICCDLSKPNNCLSSLFKWIKLIQDVVDRRLKDLQATDAPAATAFRYKDTHKPILTNRYATPVLPEHSHKSFIPLCTPS